jgi:hypothetical protein
VRALPGQVADRAAGPRLVEATQALGMPPFQAPGAPARLLAAKLVTLGRIPTGRSSIAHSRQLGRGEELKLSHPSIIPQSGRMMLSIVLFDHANLSCRSVMPKVSGSGRRNCRWSDVRLRLTPRDGSTK